MNAFGLSLEAMQPALLILALFVVLIAGFVRGYSGFGFALLAVPALTLVLPPAQVVPIMFLLDLALAAVLLPSAWGAINWRSLRWLLPAALLTMPLGGYALVAIPAVPMALAVSVLVLVFAVLFWRGFALKRTPGPPLALGAGAASGLLGGAIAVSGPPVILFYFSSPGTAAASRASLIFYFGALDLAGLAVVGWNGLITEVTLLWAAVLVLPLSLCVWLGKRHFFATDEATFRKIVLALIFLTGGIGLIKSGWQLLGL
ncbi:MAG: sulfite exporter TauE/SafE family protein [Rhodovibrionaceae bacterium]